MTHLIETEVSSDDPAFLYLNLHKQEKIIMIVRHHWVGFLGTILIVVGMAVFPLIVLFIINLASPVTLAGYYQVIYLLMTGFYMFLFTFLFGAWINFYYDIIFITNERIINVAQEGLLDRKISELSMKQVENVTAEVQGFLQTAFNFGLLIIETAGEGTSSGPERNGVKGYFTVSDVPDPNRLARIILENHRKAEQGEDGLVP